MALLRLRVAGRHSDDLCAYGSPRRAQRLDRPIAGHQVTAGSRCLRLAAGGEHVLDELGRAGGRAQTDTFWPACPGSMASAAPRINCSPSWSVAEARASIGGLVTRRSYRMRSRGSGRLSAVEFGPDSADPRSPFVESSLSSLIAALARVRM